MRTAPANRFMTLANAERTLSFVPKKSSMSSPVPSHLFRPFFAAAASVLLTVSGLTAADHPPSMPAANPLLTPSPLPYQFPQFDLIKDEHYAPAYAAAMAEELKEVDAIANNPAVATFENTIVALERSGRMLGRVTRLFDNLNGTITNPVMQQIEADLAPKLAAHSDAILLNSALFARIAALYDRRATLGLDPESARLLERYYKNFVRAGAKLGEADKTVLRAMNSELATLHTTFTQNVLKERNASAVVVDTREELAGLTDSEITTAAEAAKAAGHDGKFLITLLNTTGQPVLPSLENRALREKVFAASLARGSRGGEFDNRSTLTRIARLRAERANLLGYATHADYQLEDQTARNATTVNNLLAQLAPPAVANARREAADMQTLIDADKGGFTLAASDWSHYTEKVRAARYA